MRLRFPVLIALVCLTLFQACSRPSAGSEAVATHEATESYAMDHTALVAGPSATGGRAHVVAGVRPLPQTWQITLAADRGSVLAVAGNGLIYAKPGIDKPQITLYGQRLDSAQATPLITLENTLRYTDDYVILQDRYLYFIVADASTGLVSPIGETLSITNRIVCVDTQTMRASITDTFTSADELVYVDQVDDHRFLLNRTASTDHTWTHAVALYDTQSKSLTTLTQKQATRPSADLPWRAWMQKEGSLIRGERILCFDYFDGHVYVVSATMQAPIAYYFEKYDLSGTRISRSEIDKTHAYFADYDGGHPLIRQIDVNDAFILLQGFGPYSALVGCEGTKLGDLVSLGDFRLFTNADFADDRVLLSGEACHYLWDNTTQTMQKLGLLDKAAYREIGFTYDGGAAMVSSVDQAGETQTIIRGYHNSDAMIKALGA